MEIQLLQQHKSVVEARVYKDDDEGELESARKDESQKEQRCINVSFSLN